MHTQAAGSQEVTLEYEPTEDDVEGAIPQVLFHPAKPLYLAALDRLEELATVLAQSPLTELDADVPGLTDISGELQSIADTLRREIASRQPRADEAS